LELSRLSNIFHLLLLAAAYFLLLRSLFASLRCDSRERKRELPMVASVKA
jgi:hypothetical protein